MNLNEKFNIQSNLEGKRQESKLLKNKQPYEEMNTVIVKNKDHPYRRFKRWTIKKKRG